MNNHLPRQLYCLTEVKRKAVGQFRIVLPIDPNQHSKTILLCLTESTSTAMTIDCLTETWSPTRQLIVLPKFSMVDKTILLSYCHMEGLVRHLNCLPLLIVCLAHARLSFLLVFVLSFLCLTSTKLCLYIWLSFFISKCSSLCNSKHL